MKYRFGISLMELLVTVAIIMILAAIIFPIISRVRLYAYKQSSVSNLNQLWLATSIYRDNQGDYSDQGTPAQMGLPQGVTSYLPNTLTLRPPLVRFPFSAAYHDYIPVPASFAPIQADWVFATKTCGTNVILFGDGNYGDYDAYNPGEIGDFKTIIGITLGGNAHQQTSPGFTYLEQWWHCSGK